MRNTTRVTLIELPDTRAEDLLHMAIQKWNEDNADEPIRWRPLHTSIVGDWRD